jgi:hypothetical protein
MTNFNLSTIANVATIANNAKAKIDVIAESDASTFFDGEKLKTQTLANLLMISAGAAKNKYDAAKGTDKYEKLHFVLSNAGKDGLNVEEIQANAVANALNGLILKQHAKGKKPEQIADSLDISVEQVKAVIATA